MEETILSVIGQSYPDIEYIIVDGVSQDQTMQIIEKYKSKIAQVICEKDKGMYDAINKGIEAATGEYIGILHSDDFFINGFVVEKYARLFSQPHVDAVYSDLYYVKQDNPNQLVRKWQSGSYKTNSFLNGWMPPHPTFFVKKEIYTRYGKFDLSFTSAADYELMLRFIYRHKINVAYLPEYTIKMRVGGKSNASLKNRIKANLEDRRAWRVNNLKARFYTLLLKPLRKILQFI